MTKDLIGDFLSDYRQRHKELGKQLPQDEVLRALLEEFELYELNEISNSTRLRFALRSLKRRSKDSRKMRATMRAVSSEIAALRSRLERQRDANYMMQEHLVMLSDQLSNSRTVRSTEPPIP